MVYPNMTMIYAILKIGYKKKKKKKKIGYKTALMVWPAT